MSGTASTPPAETPATELPSDKLLTPQTVIAFMGMIMAYSIVWKILYNGTETLQSQVLMLAQNLVVAIVAFYFGSSKGSADKDAKAPVVRMAPVVPGAVSPTIVSPAVVAATVADTAATAANTAAVEKNTATTAANTEATKENP